MFQTITFRIIALLSYSARFDWPHGAARQNNQGRVNYSHQGGAIGFASYFNPAYRPRQETASAQRLTDADKVPLAVLEPSGQFTDSALARVVPGDFSDTAYSLEPRKVVLLEYHTARSQFFDRRLEVRDLPSHLCVVAGGSAAGDEQGEGPASTAIEKSPGPFFNGLKP